MRKASWYIHPLSILKRQHLTICVTKSVSWSEVNCYIENRTLQAGYQLCLGVFLFLIMQPTQREHFLAISLVDLNHMKVD